MTSVNLMAQNETLSERQQGIVAIAANEARGDLARLASSIEYGLDNGLTVNQVKEILSHLYAYTGFPRSLNGLGTLQKVLDQRTADGKQTEIGPEASPIPEDFDALKVGTKEAYRASQAIAKVFGEEFTEKQPFADMDFPKGQPNSAYAEENPATNGLSLSRMSNMPLAGNNQNQITL